MKFRILWTLVPWIDYLLFFYETIYFLEPTNSWTRMCMNSWTPPPPSMIVLVCYSQSMSRVTIISENEINMRSNSFVKLGIWMECRTFLWKSFRTETIHEFFSSDVLWKLFDIGFPYKHCYFKPVCLLVKMASKTVIRPIYMSVLMSAMRFQSSRRNFPSLLTV